MREFSPDKALNREYDKFLAVITIVHLGGKLFLLLLVVLIFHFECPSGRLTTIGWLEFISWLAAVLFFIYCFKHRKGLSRILEEWEQSLLRRKKDIDGRG